MKLSEIPVEEAQILSQVLHAALVSADHEPLLFPFYDENADGPSLLQTELVREICGICLLEMEVPDSISMEVGLILASMLDLLRTLAEYGTGTLEERLNYIAYGYGITWSSKVEAVLAKYIAILNPKPKMYDVNISEVAALCDVLKYAVAEITTTDANVLTPDLVINKEQQLMFLNNLLMKLCEASNADEPCLIRVSK